MKYTIIWAGQNKFIAQVLLTILILIVGIGGILLGISASLDGFTMSTIPFVVIATSFFLPIIILYPSKKQLRKIGVSRGYFRKWKIYDLSLVLILASTAFFIGNQSTHKSFNELSGAKLLNTMVGIPITVNVANIQNERETLKEIIKKKIRIFQTKLINFTKNLKAETDTGYLALNTLLIILMYIAYLLIIFYAALLACSLACNGMGAAAFLVILGTQVVLLIGIFFGIRALLKQRMKWIKREWSKKELNWRIALATLGALLSPSIFFLLSGG